MASLVVRAGAVAMDEPQELRGLVAARTGRPTRYTGGAKRPAHRGDRSRASPGAPLLFLGLDRLLRVGHRAFPCALALPSLHRRPVERLPRLLPRDGPER